MTFSKIGRKFTALVASAALGLGMTACGGGTIGYLWVAGTYYNQISGFKIDDYTGNLTAIDHQPFQAGGSNPALLLVKPGGRFVYVIDSGTGEVGVPNPTAPATYTAPQGAGISVYSVGGGGELTFEQTYQSKGFHPLYAAFDSTGNYLYVLDKYSPNYCVPTSGTTCTNSSGVQIGPDTDGSVSAFAVASDTGRLTTITNTSTLNTNSTATLIFEVQPNPTMIKDSPSGCLFTLSSNEVYPYVVSSANGQLTVAATGTQTISPVGLTTTPAAVNLTSINTSAGTSATSFTFFTDAANNAVYSFQSASNCTLTPVGNSNPLNVPNVFPTNSITANNGKFLYVLNSNNPATGNTTTTQSSISAYTINSSGQIALLSDGNNNPYPVGSGPVCAVEDPSSQYLYTSNNADGTITGKVLNQTFGSLSDLAHGSQFTTTMNPTCLAVSGSI